MLVPCQRCMQRPASKGHNTCRQCREPDLQPVTPTNTLREVDESQLYDTGFRIDCEAVPAMFIFPDGTKVPAPSDLARFGYFLRQAGTLWTGVLRVMKRIKS